MPHKRVDSPDRLPWIGGAEPLSSHPKSWVEASAFMLYGIGAAIAGIAAAVLMMVTPDFAAPPNNYILAGLCLAGGASVLAYYAYRYRPKLESVRVYPEGIAWSDGDGWRGLPWTTIKRFYRAEVKVNSVWKTREFALESRDDEKVVIEATVWRWAVLADLVEQQHEQAWWPRISAAFDSGKTIKCGPISVSQTGVQFEQSALTWGDIKQVHVGNGQIWIEAHKGKKGCHLAMGDIANFNIFYRLVQAGTNDEV